MSGVDIHISLNNVPQFEKNQSQNNRAPLVFQGQNAQISQDELLQRIRIPVEPEQAEGKKVDPKDKKQQSGSGKKQQKEQTDEQKKRQRKSKSDEGFFVDLQA